jgi:hypothetical protein
VPVNSYSYSFRVYLHFLRFVIKMSCPSTLSASATTKLNARINELINDGCSNSEIVRVIRREAKSPKCAWPDMSFSRIKKLIDAAIEEAETSSESSHSSAPTFESDEEDEEYVPSESDESEESEAEESEAEESEAEESEAEESEELRKVVIYMDRKESSEIDRMTITPQDDGLFAVEFAYDLKNASAYPRRANFFEADTEEILGYVRNTMCFVAADELPFKSVEFSIPFYPNISLRPKTLGKKDVRNVVLTALQQFLEHYAYV